MFLTSRAIIRCIVHDPYLTQPVEIQKWTLPLNFGDALCCVGACRFSWPLPKKGEFKLHVGYHVKDWEWYVEYTFDSYILWSGRLLKGRHVDLLIDGIFSMRVLPLLVYQGLACLLILTGHVCGQGKEIWTPSAFW